MKKVKCARVMKSMWRGQYDETQHKMSDTTPQRTLTAASVPENMGEGETTARPEQHSATTVGLGDISEQHADERVKIM